MKFVIVVNGRSIYERPPIGTYTMPWWQIDGDCHDSPAGRLYTFEKAFSLDDAIAEAKRLGPLKVQSTRECPGSISFKKVPMV